MRRHKRRKGFRRVATDLTITRAKLHLAHDIIVTHLDINDLHVARLLELVYDGIDETGEAARQVRSLGGGGYVLPGETLPPPPPPPPPVPAR